MAFSAKVSQFACPNATGVQSIGGLGFQPKAILLWAAVATTEGTFFSNAQQSIGFGTSSAAQRAVGYAGDGGVGTTNTAARWHQSVLVTCNGAGTISTECDVSTLWADGFNVNWATILNSMAVNYLAIGGADLTNVTFGVFSLSTVTGTQTVGGVGFQPDAIILLCANRLNSQLNNSLGNAKCSFGIAESSTQRWAWGLTAADGQAMTTTVAAKRTQRADSCLVGLTDLAAADFQVNHTSMLADGFSVNVIDAPASAYEVAYLALKGGSYDVNVFGKSTGTAPVSQAVTVGFSAAVLLLATCQMASTAAITGDVDLGFGLGDFVGPGQAEWVAIADSALSSAARIEPTGTILICCSRAIPSNIFIGSLTGRVASGYNLTWTTNNGEAAQIGYFAFGDAVVAAPTFIFRNRERTQLRM